MLTDGPHVARPGNRIRRFLGDLLLDVLRRFRLVVGQQLLQLVVEEVTATHTIATTATRYRRPDPTRVVDPIWALLWW